MTNRPAEDSSPAAEKIRPSENNADTASPLRASVFNSGQTGFDEARRAFEKSRETSTPAMGSFPRADGLLAGDSKPNPFGIGQKHDCSEHAGRAHGQSPEAKEKAEKAEKAARAPENDGTGDKSLKPEDLQKHFQDLQKKYGVNLGIKDGHFTMSLSGTEGQYARGSGEIKATPEGLKDVEKALDTEAKERIKKLESDYPGIKLRPPGQFLGNQEDTCLAERGLRPKENPNAPSAIKSRQPTLTEIKALEDALASSGDNTKTLNGKPLLITYADKGTQIGQGGKEVAEGAHYLPPEQNKGVAEVRVNPSSPTSAPTDKDVIPGSRAPSMAYVLRHEFGHNAERNAFGPGSRYPDSIINPIGFKRVPNMFRGPGEPSHMEAVKVNDQGTEKYFINLPPSCNSLQGGWIRVDPKSGRFLDTENGKPIELNRKGEPDAKHVRDHQWVGERAAVKHPTPYFDNPNEVMSEAMALYTGTPEMRARLKNDFPDHYAAVEKLQEAQRAALMRQQQQRRR